MKKPNFAVKLVLLFLIVILSSSCATSTVEFDEKPIDLTPGLAQQNTPYNTPNKSDDIVQPTVSEPNHLYVAPDGSGDTATLQEAFTMLPPYGTLMLAEGTYTLERTIIPEKPISIIGAGSGQTIITASGGDALLVYNGPENIYLKGISFVYAGSEAVNVVSISNAALYVEDCEFEGGVYHQEQGIGGKGLEISGNCTGTVVSVKAMNNQSQGIYIRDGSSITIESGIIAGNTHSGLVFTNNSSGIVKNTEISNNKSNGIIVTDHSKLLIENSACINNDKSGMLVSEEADVEAYNNSFSKNGSSGIMIINQAVVRFKENTCNENSSSGISAYENTLITAIKNECSNNARSGIVLLGQSEAHLESNECNENASYGIAIFESSTATARLNICGENAITGIVVNANAQAILERNIAKNHSADGIGYLGNSGGIATENECFGNKYGIFIASGANPILSDNNCYDNTSANIMDNR